MRTLSRRHTRSWHSSFIQIRIEMMLRRPRSFWKLVKLMRLVEFIKLGDFFTEFTALCQVNKPIYLGSFDFELAVA